MKTEDMKTNILEQIGQLRKVAAEQTKLKELEDAAKLKRETEAFALIYDMYCDAKDQPIKVSRSSYGRYKTLKDYVDYACVNGIGFWNGMGSYGISYSCREIGGEMKFYKSFRSGEECLTKEALMDQFIRHVGDLIE